MASNHNKAHTKRDFIEKRVVHFFLILLFALLSYSNTFHVPFLFDDIPNIVENPVIRDLGNFLNAGQLKASRYIGKLSFALNYRMHGLEVIGYHIVNLLIHMVNGLLVYLLVVYSFRTPWLRGSKLNAELVGLFSGLLFVSHPVQTQAVTYIVQRYASLATLFYLLSLLLYIRWRLGGGGGRRLWWYIGSVVSAVLAMKTKEISFTLPVVVAMYEFMFFEGERRKRIVYLVPLMLTMLIIPLSMIGIDKPIGELIGDVSRTTKVQTELSRWEYLCTEFRVIVTYIRLLFLPVNQNLDYDYPLYKSLFNPEVFLSFLFLSALFGLSLYLFYRSRKGEAGLRIISFGILWFFITLSVESSLIPIVDVIFEHRMYLPSVGAFIAIVTALFVFVHRVKERGASWNRAIILILFLLVITLTISTYLRNRVWQDEVSLWSDVVRKSPNKARGYNNLAEAYINRGQHDESYIYLQRALQLKPDYADAHINLGIYYTAKRMYSKAIEHYKIALKNEPNNWKGHMNLGFAYLFTGDINRAIRHLEKSLRLFPYNAKAHLNLGIAYKFKRDYDKAEQHLKIARELDPKLFRGIR